MSTENTEKLYLQWLNDAYSQELALVPILENHAKDLESHSLDAARVRQHISETEGHAAILKECITRRGGDVSQLKAALGKITGAVTSVTSGMFSDELIKNNLSDYTAEHMEISSYTSLIAAAEATGDMQTAGACRRILSEEVAMADWLKGQIPTITMHMLDHAARK